MAVGCVCTHEGEPKHELAVEGRALVLATLRAVARGGGRGMSTSNSVGGVYVEVSGIPGTPAIVFVHGMGQSGRIWRGSHGEAQRLPLPGPHLRGSGGVTACRQPR
jgi:pimeloyl-ACP methyl ester carboxylesterase